MDTWNKARQIREHRAFIASMERAQQLGSRFVVAPFTRDERSNAANRWLHPGGVVTDMTVCSECGRSTPTTASAYTLTSQIEFCSTILAALEVCACLAEYTEKATQIVKTDLTSSALWCERCCLNGRHHNHSTIHFVAGNSRQRTLTKVRL
jgi:hypothetical protein